MEESFVGKTPLLAVCNVVLIAAVACACQQDAAPIKPAAAVTSSPIDLAQGFTFHDQQFPCAAEGTRFQNFCVVTVPNRWIDSEKAAIRTILTRLGTRPGIKTVLSDVLSAGYGRLFKFRFGFQTDNQIDFIRRDRANAWVGAPTNAISVNQRFLDVTFTADPIGGFDVKDVMLLHEVFHALDRIHHYSETPAFMTAFEEALSGVNRKQCLAIRDRFVDASNSGRDNEARSQMRTALQSLPTAQLGRHLPGAAVCLRTNDRYLEAFADYAAYWYLDPTASSYYPEAIARWLRTKMG